MVFKGNHVMTTNSEVNEGDEICYYESLPTTICNCKVIGLWNNENDYGFKLLVTEGIDNAKTGEEFTIWAIQGNYAYAGMWRLYNKGKYK
jgi:hypothetical protein